MRSAVGGFITSENVHDVCQPDALDARAPEVLFSRSILTFSKQLSHDFRAGGRGL